jgi:GT2 family glycosyltransferase
MTFRYDISIVIVSYNCLDSLKTCIESLERQQSVRFEIMVFDNKSSDGTGSFLRAQTFEHILSKENIGFGAAVNRAAARAEGQYLFILNPDTIVPPSALSRLLEYARNNPEAGIVAPALCYPDGRSQLSARRLPSRRDILAGRGSPLRIVGLADERKAGYIVHSGGEPMNVPAVSATAVLIETAFFRKLGGFDERFFMYMEDLDLCLRIKNENKGIILLPDVLVIHIWRQSSGKRPYFSSYHHHLSIYKYFAKHHPAQLPLNLLLLVGLAAGLCVTFLLIFMGLRGRT